jgi:hypothetical protein
MKAVVLPSADVMIGKLTRVCQNPNSDLNPDLQGFGSLLLNYAGRKLDAEELADMLLVLLEDYKSVSVRATKLIYAHYHCFVDALVSNEALATEVKAHFTKKYLRLISTKSVHIFHSQGRNA